MPKTFLHPNSTKGFFGLALFEFKQALSNIYFLMILMCWIQYIFSKPLDQIKKIQVIKTEEKGSDVNIATLLLVDGIQNKYETAAVISNDSDL